MRRTQEVQPGEEDGGREQAGVRKDPERQFIPKTLVAFWRARVERRTYEDGGKTPEVPEYPVWMKLGGVRRPLIPP